jgi:hypothetical protein
MDPHKTKPFFVQKTNECWKSWTGNHSAKMGTDNFSKNTPNAPKLIWPICPIRPNVWHVDGKRLHRASIVSDSDPQELLLILA